MTAPTPAPGDERPREGYYPDPSIPGYVRYWNGAAWVPGTSRPAPADGEPLAPPPGSRPATPAAPAVEETGPHFFDEDPQPGASGWAAEGSAWGTDPRAAAGSPPQPDGQSSRTDGTATIPPAGQGDADSGGTFIFRRPTVGPAGTPPAARPPMDDGTMTFRPIRAKDAPNTGAPAAAPGSGGPAFTGRGPDAASPAPQGRGAGAAGFSGQGGGAGAGGQGSGGAAGAGGRGAGAGGQGSGAGAGAGGQSVGSGGFGVPGSGGPGAAGASGPGGYGAQGPAGAAGFGTPGGGRSGFGAGKAAAERAAGAQAAPASAAPQAVAPAVPPQSAGPQPAPASPATPVTAGPGGGQSSWAQQVHQLAGDQPVAPWKPPVEDVFQAAARRQASARPAGLGKRFAARLVDSLVVGAVTAVAAVPFGTQAAGHVQDKIDAAKLSGRTETVWLLDGTTGLYLGVVLAVLLLVGVLYEVLPTAKWGRTLGKKLLGLEVRDIEGHEPPAFGASLRRWLVYTVPGLLGIGIIGVAWCLFDRPWHQCWHDKAAHTFVAG
ncbi:RDD family protein [Streptomyces sp. NPDC005917]|uniref:RDD family protein n=1 Tax=unclassified Streptomyces TaxID=2593676 RepID=UPI0033CA51A5